MVDKKPSFLGSVMKAIACTPNRNFDDRAYSEGVIEPTRNIRKLMEQHGENPLQQDQIKSVMKMLLTIFETKLVDMDERQDRINEILNLHNLENDFPDLLPLIKESD